MPQIDLLIFDSAISSGPDAETRFGGLPSVDKDFSWPQCRFCATPMLFLGQVRGDADKRLHLAFMCENRPGVCWQWDPDRGGNAIICVEIDDLQIAKAPTGDNVVRKTAYGASIERIEAPTYDKARVEWSNRHPDSPRQVLGQIGGEADWLQDDETPNCDHCRKPMQFVAQLETGPDYETEMNFAGGCGYIFKCDCGVKLESFCFRVDCRLRISGSGSTYQRDEAPCRDTYLLPKARTFSRQCNGYW